MSRQKNDSSTTPEQEQKSLLGGVSEGGFLEQKLFEESVYDLVAFRAV